MIAAGLSLDVAIVYLSLLQLLLYVLLLAVQVPTTTDRFYCPSCWCFCKLCSGLPHVALLFLFLSSALQRARFRLSRE